MSMTLTQIARQLKLSPMTVSRALRGTGRMRPQTRARVVAAAARLGYRPNVSARAMRSGRSGCVALLVSPTAEHGVLPQELVWGIERELAAQNRYLALARVTTARTGAAAEGVPKLLGELLADGILLNYTHRVPREMERQIDALSTPAVWINRKRPRDAVYVDDHGGFERATVRLLAMGHTRIAYADYYVRADADAADWHYSTVDRYAGYAAAMAEAGRPARRLVIPAPAGGRPPDRPVAFTRTWLTDAPRARRPTAVVCYDEYTALAILHAAATTGIRVPADLSIVSAAVGPLDAFDRSIATLTVPAADMGRAAVMMLFTKMERRVRHATSAALPMLFESTDGIAPPP